MLDNSQPQFIVNELTTLVKQLELKSNMNAPKYYADVCAQMGQSVQNYSDYESFEVKFQ